MDSKQQFRTEFLTLCDEYEIDASEMSIEFLDKAYDKAIQVQARVSPKVADITRIVVIDHQKKNCENFGRIVDEWNIKLNFSYQDDNKTLKVIISDR